jgi:hypothetical protein
MPCIDKDGEQEGYKGHYAQFEVFRFNYNKSGLIEDNS